MIQLFTSVLILICIQLKCVCMFFFFSCLGSMTLDCDMSLYIILYREDSTLQTASGTFLTIIMSSNKSSLEDCCISLFRDLCDDFFNFHVLPQQFQSNLIIVRYTF